MKKILWLLLLIPRISYGDTTCSGLISATPEEYRHSKEIIQMIVRSHEIYWKSQLHNSSPVKYNLDNEISQYCGKNPLDTMDIVGDGVSRNIFSQNFIVDSMGYYHEVKNEFKNTK